MAGGPCACVSTVSQEVGVVQELVGKIKKPMI